MFENICHLATLSTLDAFDGCGLTGYQEEDMV